jgi:hypothetical protein
VWDFRYPSSNPINVSPQSNDNVFQPNDVGQLAAPGNYTVTLSKYVDGVITDLAGPEKFVVNVLPGAALPAASRPALVEWQRKAAELQREITGAGRVISDANSRIRHLKEAIMSVARPNQEFVGDVRNLEEKMRVIQLKMNGDRVAGQLDIDSPPSIQGRLFSAIYSGYGSTSDPTTTMKEQLQIATEEFEGVLNDLKTVVNTDLKALEQKMEAAGAPYTPGRVPEIKK